MGIYEKHVLPWVLHIASGFGSFERERPKALAGARGTVLEIGFGSGLNIPHYGSGVDRLVGVEPLAGMVTKAQRRIKAAPFPVEVLPLRGEELPVEAGSVDAAVSTLTLCSIAEPERALANVRQALKPGGRYHFLEHGRAPEERVRRTQDRLNGVWGKLGGGCHLNREIDRLIAGAGFRIETLERYFVPGPRFLCFLYRGQAVRV
jgi:SAM-dependent methyltransferase